MKTLQYLLDALNNRKELDYGWLISLLTVFKPLEPTHNYDIVHVGTGYGYYFKNAIITLDGTDNTKPLLDPTVKAELVMGALPNVTAPVSTCLGNVLTNGFLLCRCFGDTIPFITGRHTTSTIRKIIAPLLVDTPKRGETLQQGKISVKQYRLFISSIDILGNLAKIIAYTATPKNIVPPDGIEAYKKSLLDKIKKDGKDINDPLVLVKFENDLRDFDTEFLKDDPSMGIMMSGPMKNKARLKLHMSYGSEADFEDGKTTKTVTRSLSEGIIRDTEEYADTVNSIRSGSYSRGVSTVLGGVSGKVLVRALSGYRITDKDCKSKLTYDIVVGDNDIARLDGRNIVVDGKIVPLDHDKIKGLIGKTVHLRSPMYCKSEGYCEVCSGARLAESPAEVTAYGTAISGKIMGAFFKKMHGLVRDQVETDIEEALS
jgi:hypothetical protein